MKIDKKLINRGWAIGFLCYFALLLTIFVLAYCRMIPVKLARIPCYDTIGHFVLYGFTGYLAHRALNRKHFSVTRLPIPSGPTLIAVFAIIEESLQSLSPYRTFSLGDLSANFLGLLLFYIGDLIIVKVAGKDEVSL